MNDIGGVRTGVVIRHEPYGFFVDLGASEEGLVVITMVHDDPHETPVVFPAVGSTVEVVLLGRTEVTGQIRLSVRLKDVGTACRPSPGEALGRA